MNEQTMWIVGGGAVVLALLMSRSGGGATVINRNDPNAAESDRARADFAARGLDSLAGVAKTDINGGVSRYMADANTKIAQSRDAAYAASARAYAGAQEYSARQASKGKSGFSIPTPWGAFGIHW